MPRLLLVAGAAVADAEVVVVVEEAAVVAARECRAHPAVVVEAECPVPQGAAQGQIARPASAARKRVALRAVGLPASPSSVAAAD